MRRRAPVSIAQAGLYASGFRTGSNFVFRRIHLPGLIPNIILTSEADQPIFPGNVCRDAAGKDSSH